MTADGSNGEGDGPREPAFGPAGRPRLRAVVGPVDRGAAPPPVRLVREYKGLTVADMFRDEIVERLPGQLRTALHHAQRGDWAAAEAAVPGRFAEVLPGPGAARRPPRRLLWIVVTAALGAAALASWWF